MSVPHDILRLQLNYSAWAGGRLLDAASQLSPAELERDFATADKSVLGTLVHIFAADRLWLRRVLGEPQGDFITPADYSLAVVQDQWPRVWEGWSQWIDRFSGPTGQVLAYQDLKGRAHSSKAWMIVLHVVNHATHHRGQVSGFLRMLGKAPPPLDLIAYYRNHQA